MWLRRKSSITLGGITFSSRPFKKMRQKPWGMVIPNEATALPVVMVQLDAGSPQLQPMVVDGSAQQLQTLASGGHEPVGPLYLIGVVMAPPQSEEGALVVTVSAPVSPTELEMTLVEIWQAKAHVALARQGHLDTTDGFGRWSLVDPGPYFAMVPPSRGVYMVDESGRKWIDTSTKNVDDGRKSWETEDLLSDKGTDGCFETDVETLGVFERTRMQLVGRLRPNVVLTPKGKRESTPYELCPNGFMVMWDALQRLLEEKNVVLDRRVKLLDLGSGLGGVCLMAALLGGCEATGIEIQPEFHEGAQQWHKNVATHDRLLACMLNKQSEERLFCGDMLSVQYRRLYAEADIIFCNNLLFDRADNDSTILNGHLAIKLRDWATNPNVIIVTSAAVCGSQGGLGLQQVKTIQLPDRSVSWSPRGIQLHMTCRSD